MNLGYRQKAREALKRAKTELESGDQQRLPYAALELRFSMESLTYDRALAFRKELSPDKFDVWQPRDLMKHLHDLDPSLGLNCTVSVRNMSRVLRQFLLEFSVVVLCCGGRSWSVSPKPPGQVNVGDGVDNLRQLLDGLGQRFSLC